MIPRLTFTARIGLVVALSVALAWLASVSLFYLSQRREVGGVRLLPSEVAAIVQLLEASPPGQRPLVLRAVSSASLNARLLPAASLRLMRLAPGRTSVLTGLESATVKAYLAAHGGRPVTVTVPRGVGGASLIVPRPMEIRVLLATGETLVIDTRSAVLANLFGLPVGFGVGLFSIVVALIGLYLLQRETEPLVRLAAAVDRIDLARPPEPLPDAPRSAPEIRALIVAFNRLQARLFELVKARMVMLGGISHDVRTFATRLRLRIDLIPAGAEHDRAVSDIEDMIRLLDNALLASRAGAGELMEELIEFVGLVKAETNDRRALGHAVELRILNRDLEVLGDRVALRRVIGNVIDNALAYGEAARLEVSRTGSLAVLTVDDDGPGFPAADRRRLLEPFVRLEASRNRKTGGAGLGLAVVRNLVEAHGGSVMLSDAPQFPPRRRGGRVTVTLPLFGG